MIIELRGKSQVTIPSEIVKQLSLNVGDKFEAVVKKGALMLIPVEVYPKDTIKSIENEIIKLKKQIENKKRPVFHSLDKLYESLDK